MPLKVMKNIVGILPPDYLIVDPFAGSGTTIVACKELGREYIGIESDMVYFEEMEKRLEESQ
jgi:DNA modification methylase